MTLSVPAPRRGRSLTRGPRLLIAGYFAVLVVVAATATPALVQTIHTLDRQQSVFDPVSGAVGDLLVAGLNQETGMRGYALTADPTFLQPFSQGATEYDQASTVLRHAAIGTTFSGEVARTLSSYQRWHRYALAVNSDVAAGRTSAARALAAQQIGKDYFDDFRAQDGALAATVRSDVSASRQELRHQVLLSLVALLAAIVVGVAVGTGMWLWWRLWGKHNALSEQRLADSAVLLQSAIDASSDGIFAKDLEGRHILANRARIGALHRGDADAEVIGHAIDDYVDADAAAQVREHERQVLLTGEPRRSEEELSQPDGAHVYAVTKNPLRRADGAITGIVGVARDVTEELALLADRERLYQLEHRLAQTIQLSLLGNERLDGARVTARARYLPAIDELAVGGDWYDLIALDGDRVALIVGDAVGHGLISATAMGQLRSALSALAVAGFDPARALQALDEFAQTIPSAHMATCLLAVIDAAGQELSYSSAGQTPPVVVTGAEARVLWDRQGPPLTAPRTHDRLTTTIPFPNGSTIVLCTDGLVERRSESIDDGLERLREVVERARDTTVEQLCDQLVSELVAPGRRTDDIAVVAARLVGSA